jgi:hypothetical protein
MSRPRLDEPAEEDMLDIFRNGGIGMYPTAFFGLLLLAVAARYAVRPENRWIPLQIALGIVTLSVGATSFVGGLIATTTHLEQTGDRAGIIGAVGFGESLNNVALALALVAIAAMATTVGVARNTRQQAADA